MKHSGSNENTTVQHREYLMPPFEITMTYCHPLPTLPLSFYKIHLDVVSVIFIFYNIPHHNYPYTPRQPLLQVHALLLVTLDFTA
jgi:hypothetical protein